VSTPESVPSHLARLNAAIDDVAQRPGWSYDRVAREAGFSVMTLHSLRWGKTKEPTDRVAWALDRVLGFKEGKGVQRILAGKSPIKAEGPKPEDETDKAIRRIREMKHLSDFQKEMLINTLEETRQRVIEQAEEMDAKQADRNRDSA
jgi:hypothetical protein